MQNTTGRRPIGAPIKRTTYIIGWLGVANRPPSRRLPRRFFWSSQWVLFIMHAARKLEWPYTQYRRCQNSRLNITKWLIAARVLPYHKQQAVVVYRKNTLIWSILIHVIRPLGRLRVVRIRVNQSLGGESTRSWCKR